MQFVPGVLRWRQSRPFAITRRELRLGQLHGRSLSREWPGIVSAVLHRYSGGRDLMQLVVAIRVTSIFARENTARRRGRRRPLIWSDELASFGASVSTGGR